MKWLECIRVRAVGDPQELIAFKLLKYAEEFENSPGLSAADVYVHASVNGDFAIFLYWNTSPPQPMGSPIGLNLREALKRYGLVNHTVWIEKQ